MNILVVYPYIPFPLDRGTYQRTFHLLKGLAAHHTVDLIALSENGERLENAHVFESFCRRVTFVPFSHPNWEKLLPNRLFHPLPSTIRHWKSEELAATIREQLKSQNYDAVHVCDIVLAQYFLREHRDIPLVVDRSRVDLQFQWQQTRFNTPSLKDRLLACENIIKLWFYERKVAKRSLRQVLCGPDDKTFIRKWISRRVPLNVIPNGVDLDYFNFDPKAVSESSPTIVFCGAMDYTPNIDALRWYFGEIHGRITRSIPQLQVIIVGRGAGPEIKKFGEQEGVTVTGGVPDVRPYYRKSWLQIVPLRIGGGTRLKIVESLSLGVPVVSTTIGAQGLGLKDRSEILLADHPDAFAARVMDGLTSPLLRKTLSEKGRVRASTTFCWERIGKQLADTYQDGTNRTREKVRLLGVPFDRVSMNGALARITEMVEKRTPHQIATANVDFLVQSRKDSELRTILEEADLVLCDGTPLVWLSRLLGKSLPERVAGSDLAPHLLDLAERKQWRVFFLGGEEASLAKAVEKIQGDYPKLQLAGSHSPPYAPLDEMDHKDMVERIDSSSADLLFVCFGCPKQEKWLARHLTTTGVPVGIGLGATIDFLAGSKNRAPHWMRLAGMEWIFRLAQEPRRLFRRYATDLIVFGAAVLKELSGKKTSAKHL